MPDPATPIVNLAETQLQIQAATAGSRDAIAVGVLGVDAALIAAAMSLRSTLGHEQTSHDQGMGARRLVADDHRHADRHPRWSMSALKSTPMSEQTTLETNAPASGVEQLPGEPRLPSGPLPSFGEDIPSLELPGLIPSWQAIMRALRRLRPHRQS